MGWWESVSKLGVGGLVGGKDSGFFKEKKITPEAVAEPSYYPKLRESLGNRLQGLIETGPEKYGGELVAPLSQYQQQSLGKLGDFANQGPPSLIGEGANEISKTLASQYDPATSAYFQAFRDQRLFDLGQSKNRFNEDAAGAGRFFHGARVEGLRKLDESATRDINTQNATLAENERNRRTSVLGQGLNYANAQTQFPLTQIGALQTAGALPQEQAQKTDTAAYEEYLRQLTQGRSDLTQAAQFAGPIPMAYPSYAPSPFMQLLQALAPAAGSAIGAAAACHVAEVLYGEDDRRTHLARAYVASHESAFLRAYRQHSQAWAVWLRAHPVALKFFKPIWDAMVMEQLAVTT